MGKERGKRVEERRKRQTKRKRRKREMKRGQRGDKTEGWKEERITRRNDNRSRVG